MIDVLLVALFSSALTEAPSLSRLAEMVVERSGDADAEAKLREAGPRGLSALLEAADGHGMNPRVDAAIDRVAGQRYGHVSRLYWFTDLEAAKVEAAQSGRPILSLRMLGKLTDELSCANSRFFRTVLYADPQVGAVMRDRFVLHWSSERDVPIITIDFGDGRVLRRTVTGNSAHYVLDSKGDVLDIIPGLYAPSAFIGQLENARVPVNARRHAALARQLERRWALELAAIGADLAELPRGRAPAANAVPIAATKAFVEAPMVIPASELERAMDHEAWEKLVDRAPRVELSRQTLALIRAENPQLDPQQLSALIRRLSRSLARDTLQNEYRLHRQIHDYLGTHDHPAFAAANAWLYREVFATPADDPWLGLHDDTIYTGLEDAGIRAR